MSRKLFIFILTLIAFSGSLVTVFALIQERDYQLRGYSDPAREADLPFYVPRFGVNAELTRYEPEELSDQIDRMQEVHVNWVRQAIRWDVIEPNPRDYKWDILDPIIAAFKPNPDLKLIAVLVNTPPWARSDRAIDNNPTTPPENPANFAEFAAVIAARYGDVIDYYQIWDEPNLTHAWGGQEPHAASYLAVLAAAYQSIHGSDINATVISAALAPTVETGPENISDLIFLRDMYRLGAKDYMDAVAAKPYGFHTPPDDRTVAPDVLNFSRIIALREEMVKNGDGSKALWASNWGWNTLPANWGGSQSIWGQASPTNQITYTLEALDRAEREWPWIGGMTLQHWQPDANPNDPVWGFTLIDQNNTPTPLWHALAERQPSNAAYNGLFPMVNSYTEYSGVWTFGKLGADIGWVKDSQFNFHFSGTDVSLLLRQDNYSAYIYPTIDDQQANATPHDSSGNAYIVLKSGTLLPEMDLVPVGRNLGNTNHVLHIVADRGWDRWSLAGFGVSQGNMAEPYNRQIVVALITAITAIISAMVASTQLNWTPSLKWLSFVIRRFSPIAEIAFAILTSFALMIGVLFTWGDSIPNIFRKEPIHLGLAILTAGFIQLEPGVMLTIIAGLILLIIIYNHLYIGLVLTLFWSPFFLFPIELYDFAFPLAEITILITASAWAFQLFIQWSHNRKNTDPEDSAFMWRKNIGTLDYLVLLWVVLGGISLIWAEQLDRAVTELRVLFIEPALFYIIFRTIRLNKQRIMYIVNALLFAGVLVAGIGLFQFFQGQAVITAEDGVRRLASVYGSPNNVALFLGRCVPFLIAFIFIPTSRFQRIFSAIALIPIGIALILTQSVGAIFIGIPIAVISMILLIFGSRGRLVIFVFVVLAFIGFLFSLQSPRFARVLDFNEGTNFYRIRVWESAINIIHDHPVTGLGLDQFLYAFRGHYILPDAWQEPDLSHPHNIILDFWVRLGMMGVAVLLLFQIAFWRAAIKKREVFQQHNPYLLAIIIGSMGSMANLLSHGMIDNSVYVQDLVYVFMLLLGIVQLNTVNIRAIDAPPV
ncbi:MAG: O-antigen ligase family protein [Anaerolineae bacterium]|nr:O-antigen ligase family protein [Anaerolineae bacterium]